MILWKISQYLKNNKNLTKIQNCHQNVRKSVLKNIFNFRGIKLSRNTPVEYKQLRCHTNFKFFYQKTI